MPHKYTLEWLDLIVKVTLNPVKTDLSAITPDQLRTMLSRIEDEKEKIQGLLKNQIFGLTKESHIELLIKNYHSSLIILLDDAFENRKKISNKNNLLKSIYESIISCLDELLSFIEVRFSAYLSLDERVPKIYLLVSRKELGQRLTKLKGWLYNTILDRRIVDIVLKTLYSFTNRPKEDINVTFRDVLYKKELVKDIEDLEKETDIYVALSELLIYLNFNSKAFSNHFTQRIAEQINEYDSITDRLDQLLLHYKHFNQMHIKPGVILNPQYRDLKPVLSNWFVQEIFYLEKKLHLSVTPLQGKVNESQTVIHSKKEKHKILCILSSDQTGLILRAADELRILIAKSMNEVFKTIVPHLSTPYKDDLSYDGMRSKSYVAEERDKKIAIETLERIIRKIRDY